MNQNRLTMDKPAPLSTSEFVKHHENLLDAIKSPTKAKKYRDQEKAVKTVAKLKKAKGVTK